MVPAMSAASSSSSAMSARALSILSPIGAEPVRRADFLDPFSSPISRSIMSARSLILLRLTGSPMSLIVCTSCSSRWQSAMASVR